MFAPALNLVSSQPDNPGFEMEGVVIGFQRSLRLCTLLFGLGLMPGLIFAQSQANTGAIEGVVNDPAGRAVAGAMVTLTNTGTNFTRDVQTDIEGRFRGLLLPLGPYKVTVKAATSAHWFVTDWTWRWAKRLR